MKQTLLRHRRTIQLVATVLALTLVLIFGPRMDGPRMFFGIPFTTKTGVPGLTDLGWLLLILAPLATYLVTGLALHLLTPRDPRSREPA